MSKLEMWMGGETMIWKISRYIISVYIFEALLFGAPRLRMLVAATGKRYAKCLPNVVKDRMAKMPLSYAVLPLPNPHRRILAAI